MLWLFVGLAALLSGAGLEVRYQGDLSPLNIAPTFDHGHMIAWERNTDGSTAQNRIAVYGPSGTLLYHAAIQVPNGKVLLENGAVDADGMVAVAFRHPNGFAVMDQRGQQIHTVMTGSYAPTQVCIAPDHTIWLSGRGLPSENYNIFRRYSMEGRKLGEFAPKSAYPNLTSVQSHGGHAMRAAADRVVALLNREGDPNPAMEWIEFDLEGKRIQRLGQHRFFFAWALTDSGRIYAYEDANTLVSLDRATGTWKPSALPASGMRHLTGADGESLVLYNPNTGSYEWVAAP